MKLTKRERVLITILILVGIIGGFLYFFIFPLSDTIQEKRVILEEQNNFLEELRKLEQSGDTGEEGYNLKESMISFEEILPTQVKVPEIYLNILDISKKTGILQKSIQFQDPIIQSTKDIPGVKSTEQLVILPITHEFVGDYQKIENYIKEIQENKRKIDIIEYQLVHSTTSENEIRASFSLQSYALVQEGQNYSEFTEYDFMQESYGRSDPFKQ